MEIYWRGPYDVYVPCGISYRAVEFGHIRRHCEPILVCILYRHQALIAPNDIVAVASFILA